MRARARTVVMTGSEERTKALDTILWTYDQNAFLPHGTARDGDPGDQPIWITHEDENPNDASILVLTDGAVSDRIGDFARCLEMFDGNDDDAVAKARDRWKTYSAAGHQPDLLAAIARRPLGRESRLAGCRTPGIRIYSRATPPAGTFRHGR